jgi:hypothetical protein
MTLLSAGAPISASKPLVSIIWYGRNRVQSVEKEVGSVIQQSYVNWQLVVEDDGSTDGTLDWFRPLAESDARIDVSSQAASTPGEALLRALRRCKGAYIAICPAQAGLTPDALEFAVQTLERSPEIGAIACRGLLVDVDGEAAAVPFDLVMALFTSLRIAPHGGIIRRSALIESGLMREDWRKGCVELDLWCRLAMDHEIVTADRTIIDGKAGRDTALSAADADRLVDDRLDYVETLFDKNHFFGDAGDPALQYECMANQLSILREELRGVGARAVDRRRHELADKVAHLLSYDGRTQRSLERWHRMWRMPIPLEALPAVPLMLFLAWHWQSLCRSLIRFGFRARSRKLGHQEISQLPALFAELYAAQAARYNAHGQVATAIHNWRLAESLGDAMQDSMAVQAELKLPGATEASLVKVHKRWVARHVTERAPIAPCSLPKWDGQRKIRVGYHCAFMHMDTIQYMMARVFRAHDRDRFEIYGYSPFLLPPDIAQCFDVVRDTSTTTEDPDRVMFHKTAMLSHAAFRKMVCADGIDVFVELTGFSPGHRFPAMAERCAPVQVSFLNHTASSQVPNVDYVLADEICLPEAGGFEPFYSEEIYRLPGCFFCFDYRGSNYPPIVEPPSLKKGYVTFGCFGFGGKLNFQLLQLWADLLRQVPGSRLHIQNVQIVNERSRRFWAERFRSFGIDPERLILANGVDRQALLQVYADIDISLDTWPYCGGNSIAEALWHGVPVITLKDDRFASRYGASLLAAAGCADLVADSPEQYVAIAKRLAGDPARLVQLRHKLRDMSIEYGLGDSVGFARRLEDAYVDMLSRVGNQRLGRRGSIGLSGAYS